ncbi:DUF222 domain-containing protein [Cellulomonas sp. JH27-2]|uniref:HNH endonuclease signature motif containing protein n=1 Tax=Cellulomonas sp. JH27-2 TaxID=2774139 RepID=UPI00177D6EF2|nr:DUF222 domain-containing protein [Cellulomonas sp. JH27-2]
MSVTGALSVKPGGYVTVTRPGAPLAALVPEYDGRELPTFPVPTSPGGASIAEIAGRLAELEVADLGAFDLVEVAAGWAQVMAMAAAYQARAVGEMLNRDTGVGEAVVDEIACALVTTGRAAGVVVGRAAGLATSPVLEDALLAGTLDARKVDVILDETLVLHDRTCRESVVADAAAAGAGMTAPQLARYVRKLVLINDPANGKERAQRARKDRDVRLRWINDNMASLSAFLPAADAVAAMTAIDALAAGAKSATDDRTIDQRRADAFADVFKGILDSGTTPDGTLVPTRHGKRTSLQVTVGANTLLGLDDLPGDLAGYGPIPAYVARELAQDATWTRILTDPADGAFVERGRVRYRPGADLTGTVLARDVTCTFPGCQQPSARCELDHVAPFDDTRPADTQTTVDNLQALCKHHHQQKTRKRWHATRDPVTGNCVWTSPAGITYSRSPMVFEMAPSGLVHRPPPPAPEDDSPPF